MTKSHGDLVYKCEHQNCSASFRLRNELRDHYEVHTRWQGQIEEEDEMDEADPEYEIISVEGSYMDETSSM